MTSPKRWPCSPSAAATKSSGEAYQLNEDINEARELGTLRKLRARFRGADLLFIDDSFLRKLPARDDDELADVLMSHYEKKDATIIAKHASASRGPPVPPRGGGGVGPAHR